VSKDKIKKQPSGDQVFNPGAPFLLDSEQYVVIDSDPGSYPPDMRWEATPGTLVRQDYGTDKGRTGIIVGHARGRKAHRLFNKNRARAVQERQPMTADDYEILIDNEGPLIVFDNAPTEVHWFPGQSFGFTRIEAEPASGTSGQPGTAAG
jgi:hypothetical protein